MFEEIFIFVLRSPAANAVYLLVATITHPLSLPLNKKVEVHMSRDVVITIPEDLIPQLASEK